MFKTKQEAIEYLIQNPKYDSKWIDIAAGLMSEEEEILPEESLAQFNVNQLSILADAVEANKNGACVPILKLADPELNATQMEILKIGYGAEGRDDKILDTLLDPSIPYAKLNFIVKGITEGFTDIINYINYDPEQIAEIYAGFKDGVDYKIYDKQYIPAKKMTIMRYALVCALKVDYNKETGEVSIN